VPGSGMRHRVQSTVDRQQSTAGGLLSTVDSRLSTGPWLLDDQAQTASAFLAAFEHTGEGRWLDRARELIDMMLAFYWDKGEGGFFDAREQTGGFLVTRGKPIQDAPTSSANAIAA